jgi:hypothetical protein
MPDTKFLVPAEIVTVASRREFRAAIRHPCKPNFLIRLLVRPSYHNLRAFDNDLSRTGVGLFIDRNLDIGTTLVLQLLKEEHHSLIRVAQVVHATEMGDGWWLIGCRFAAPLPEKELHALLDA